MTVTFRRRQQKKRRLKLLRVKVKTENRGVLAKGEVFPIEICCVLAQISNIGRLGLGQKKELQIE